MSRHCFTYGSLMCADIMAAVCGLELAGEPASLDGYRRHPVRHEAYPGMVPMPGHAVAGVLYRNVPPEAIARLDAFEGPQYERRCVTVQLPDGGTLAADTYVFRPDGGTLAADTYVFRPEFASELLPGDWDFERFLREGKPRFERQYVGYDRL